MNNKILVTLAISSIALVENAHSSIDDSIENLLHNCNLPYTKYMTEGWFDIDIKEKLSEFIDYSENQAKILPIVEQISDNRIGEITLKLLYQARKDMPKQRLKISLQSYVSEKDGKEHYFNFAPNEFCIYLNLKKLKEAGTITYLNNKIFPCSPYEANSYLFHKLLHAFHYTIGTYKGNSRHALQYIYRDKEVLKKDWTDDEELYTITGKFLTKDGLVYDPLNANLYEAIKFYKQNFPGHAIPQRIFHTRYTQKNFEELHKRNWRYNLDKILTNFSDLGF